MGSEALRLRRRDRSSPELIQITDPRIVWAHEADDPDWNESGRWEYVDYSFQLDEEALSESALAERGVEVSFVKPAETPLKGSVPELHLPPEAFTAETVAGGVTRKDTQEAIELPFRSDVKTGRWSCEEPNVANTSKSPSLDVVEGRLDSAMQALQTFAASLQEAGFTTFTQLHLAMDALATAKAEINFARSPTGRWSRSRPATYAEHVAPPEFPPPFLTTEQREKLDAMLAAWPKIQALLARGTLFASVLAAAPPADKATPVEDERVVCDCGREVKPHELYGEGPGVRVLTKCCRCHVAVGGKPNPEHPDCVQAEKDFNAARNALGSSGGPAVLFVDPLPGSRMAARLGKETPT